MILGGLAPGSYPRGGRVHLRLWLAERFADEMGAESIAAAVLLRWYARLLGVNVEPHVDLHSAPPVTGLLHLGEGCSVEPGRPDRALKLDGDQLIVGAITVGRGARVGARSTLASVPTWAPVPRWPPVRQCSDGSGPASTAGLARGEGARSGTGAVAASSEQQPGVVGRLCGHGRADRRPAVAGHARRAGRGVAGAARGGLGGLGPGGSAALAAARHPGGLRHAGPADLGAGAVARHRPGGRASPGAVTHLVAGLVDDPGARRGPHLVVSVVSRASPPRPGCAAWAPPSATRSKRAPR